MDVGDESIVLTTCVFTQCALHQMARLLALHIVRHKISASLFSVTRLNQHSHARDQVKHAMKVLLSQRFKFQANQEPPGGFFQSPVVKSKLLDLLGGTWAGEDGSDPEELSARQTLLKDAFAFFNGNIMDESEWTHYCSGCHENRAQTLEHAPWLDKIYLSALSKNIFNSYSL